MTDNSTVDAFDFSAYQQAAARTGAPIATDHPIVYPTLGLVNEAGEVAGKVKKIFRDRHGVITDADREALTLELGDVLWYLSELASASIPSRSCLTSNMCSIIEPGTDPQKSPESLVDKRSQPRPPVDQRSGKGPAARVWRWGPGMGGLGSRVPA